MEKRNVTREPNTSEVIVWDSAAAIGGSEARVIINFISGLTIDTYLPVIIPPGVTTEAVSRIKAYFTAELVELKGAGLQYRLYQRAHQAFCKYHPDGRGWPIAGVWVSDGYMRVEVFVGSGNALRVEASPAKRRIRIYAPFGSMAGGIDNAPGLADALAAELARVQAIAKPGARFGAHAIPADGARAQVARIESPPKVQGGKVIARRNSAEITYKLGALGLNDTAAKLAKYAPEDLQVWLHVEAMASEAAAGGQNTGLIETTYRELAQRIYGGWTGGYAVQIREALTRLAETKVSVVYNGRPSLGGAVPLLLWAGDDGELRIQTTRALHKGARLNWVHLPEGLQRIRKSKEFAYAAALAMRVHDMGGGGAFTIPLREACELLGIGGTYAKNKSEARQQTREANNRISAQVGWDMEVEGDVVRLLATAGTLVAPESMRDRRGSGGKTGAKRGRKPGSTNSKKGAGNGKSG